MPTQKLRNGVDLPVLAAGVWEFSNTTAEASVAAAIEVGFPAIDTAFDYGNQPGVARALKKFPGREVFVITKVPGSTFLTVSPVEHTKNSVWNIVVCTKVQSGMYKCANVQMYECMNVRMYEWGMR